MTDDTTITRRALLAISSCILSGCDHAKEQPSYHVAIGYGALSMSEVGGGMNLALDSSWGGPWAIACPPRKEQP